MEASLARTVLQAAPVSVLAVDHGGRVYLANPRANAFWQRDLTATPTQVRDLLPGLDLDVLTQLPSGEAQSFRALICGQTRDLALLVTPFEAPEGRLLALFVRDETERLKSEDDLQKLRTEILMNWRLNSLGELAALVAHELNQPLAAMTTLVHIARDDMLAAGVRPDLIAALDSAITEAHRASDIVRRFRAMLYHETRFHADVSAQKLVADMDQLLALQARDSGVLMQTDIEDAPLQCDPVQIQQVILNLFRNACIHGRPEKHPMVVISGVRRSHVYRYSVSDNGSGFGDHPPSFEPMPSRTGTGMGLGLAISRRIVAAHGGFIEATDRASGGACVSFELPYGDPA